MRLRDGGQGEGETAVVFSGEASGPPLMVVMIVVVVLSGGSGGGGDGDGGGLGRWCLRCVRCPLPVPAPST